MTVKHNVYIIPVHYAQVHLRLMGPWSSKEDVLDHLQTNLGRINSSNTQSKGLFGKGYVITVHVGKATGNCILHFIHHPRRIKGPIPPQRLALFGGKGLYHYAGAVIILMKLAFQKIGQLDGHGTYVLMGINPHLFAHPPKLVLVGYSKGGFPLTGGL